MKTHEEKCKGAQASALQDHDSENLSLRSGDSAPLEFDQTIVQLHPKAQDCQPEAQEAILSKQGQPQVEAMVGQKRQASVRTESLFDSLDAASLSC